MSTQAASTTTVTAVAADTYISSALTYPVTVRLPEGSTVTDGDEIRLECTGGSIMIVETFTGRKVGIVPGDGQVVVVYEPGDSGDDFWRFTVLPNSPTAHNAAPDAAACWAVLVKNGFCKAE